MFPFIKMTKNGTVPVHNNLATLLICTMLTMSAWVSRLSESIYLMHDHDTSSA